MACSPVPKVGGAAAPSVPTPMKQIDKMQSYTQSRRPAWRVDLYLVLMKNAVIILINATCVYKMYLYQ